jgi:hypothetical protein
MSDILLQIFLFGVLAGFALGGTFVIVCYRIHDKDASAQPKAQGSGE